MKKIKIFIIFVVLMMGVPLTTQAATIDMNLKTNNINYEIKEEEDNILLVTLELGDFDNLEEGVPLRLYRDSGIRYFCF